MVKRTITIVLEDSSLPSCSRPRSRSSAQIHTGLEDSKKIAKMLARGDEKWMQEMARAMKKQQDKWDKKK